MKTNPLSNHPPLLAAFVDAMNARDLESFTSLFSAEASVHDEGREHRGGAEIRAWMEEAQRKYQPVLEVTEVQADEKEVVISGMVSGTFEGSPVELHYHLTIEEGKIAALSITS